MLTQLTEKNTKIIGWELDTPARMDDALTQAYEWVKLACPKTDVVKHKFVDFLSKFLGHELSTPALLDHLFTISGGQRAALQHVEPGDLNVSSPEVTYGLAVLQRRRVIYLLLSPEFKALCA